MAGLQVVGADYEDTRRLLHVADRSGMMNLVEDDSGDSLIRMFWVSSLASRSEKYYWYLLFSDRGVGAQWIDVPQLAHAIRNAAFSFRLLVRFRG